jgi:hypothetical protein
VGFRVQSSSDSILPLCSSSIAEPATGEGTGLGFVTSWVVSPDGSMIAARGPTPVTRLYPVNGAASRELPRVTGSDVPIGWIGDGLLIRRSGDPKAARGDIYQIYADGPSGILEQHPAAGSRGHYGAGVVLRNTRRPVLGIQLASGAE